jgi:dihydropteroate synthase
LVMGVLNTTPDSFSDGGLYVNVDDAIRHGLAMADQGADIVDVGGESSRPGALPVSEEEELERVLEVIAGLAGSVRVSIDTVKVQVAREAVRLGATLINDISGTLWPVAAELGVGWVAMHMRGAPRAMQDDPTYDDVVSEVAEMLMDLCAQASAAGIREIWADPGIGFGKTAAHNLSLLRHLARFDAIRRDGLCTGVMIGTSKKAFLGGLGPAGTSPVAPAERAEATLATTVWAMTQGAMMVRVHDVAPARLGAELCARARESGTGASDMTQHEEAEALA